MPAGISADRTVPAECADAVRPLGPAQPPSEIVKLLDQVDLTTLDNAAFAALLPAAGIDLTGANAAVTRFLSALCSPHLG